MAQRWGSLTTAFFDRIIGGVPVAKVIATKVTGIAIEMIRKKTYVSIRQPSYKNYPRKYDVLAMVNKYNVM